MTAHDPRQREPTRPRCTPRDRRGRSAGRRRRAAAPRARTRRLDAARTRSDDEAPPTCSLYYARMHARFVGARSRGLALRSGDRLSVLAGLRRQSRLGSAARGETFADLKQVRAVSGRVAARRSGPAMDSEGARRESRCSFSKPAATTGVPKTRVAFDDFRTDYELFSETLPDDNLPKGSNWLMLGPSGPRRLRLVGRTSRAISRRHLLLRRSRSALGRSGSSRKGGATICGRTRIT